jgi:hypothetical protein
MWEQRRLEESVSSENARGARIKSQVSKRGIGKPEDDPDRKGRPKAVMVDGRTVGIETGWGKDKQFHRVSPEQSDRIAQNWTDLKRGDKSVWDVIGGNPFAPPAAPAENPQQEAAPQAGQPVNPASGPDDAAPPALPSHPASPLDIKLGPPGHEEVLREDVESGMGGGDDAPTPPGDKPLRGDADDDILYWSETEGKWKLLTAPTVKSVLVWDDGLEWVEVKEYTC